jgi:predicted kinase
MGESAMPIIVVMCGLPASGKSYAVNRFLEQGDMVVCSTDAYIEKYACMVGKTYNDVFSECIDEATKVMWQTFYDAVKARNDIIMDQTNLTVKKRKYILDCLESVYANAEYYKVAYVVPMPDMNTWQARLRGRPGKTIPSNVLNSMATNYVKPTLCEGFDAIRPIEITKE